MSELEDEEEQYLATLHELEATQEDIASYQGLLKDLPEIYERKFNERLKPILDRQQHLIDEHEHLLQQLHLSLPAADRAGANLLAPASDPAAPAPDVKEQPHERGPGRPWWLLGLAALGLTIGLQLQQRSVPGSATPASSSPSRLEGQQLQDGASRTTPATTLRGRVVARAMAEWAFFDQPTLQDGTQRRVGRKEGDPGQWQRVITYWQEGLQNNSVKERADVVSSDYPWSAAFIAYVMKKAGAGDQFPYAASHSGSIKEAIYNRKHSRKNVNLIGHRVGEYAPRPGDLVCATRSWAIGQVNYDNASRFDFFPSRCELVIRANPDQISTIGGDLLDAVTLHNSKAVQGKIAPEAAQDWLVIIQTQML
jgi:hypothetical protein